MKQNYLLMIFLFTFSSALFSSEKPAWKIKARVLVEKYLVMIGELSYLAKKKLFMNYPKFRLSIVMLNQLMSMTINMWRK